MNIYAMNIMVNICIFPEAEKRKLQSYHGKYTLTKPFAAYARNDLSDRLCILHKNHTAKILYE